LAWSTSSRSKPIGELVAVGAVAGLVGLGLSVASLPRVSQRAPRRATDPFDARDVRFELHTGPARVSVLSHDRSLDRDVALQLVVDGVPCPILLERRDLKLSGDMLWANMVVTLEDPQTGGRTMDATLGVRVDVPRNVLEVSVHGRVTGTTEGALIFGRDGQGRLPSRPLRARLPCGPSPEPSAWIIEIA
jgi:hypothetical protein